MILNRPCLRLVIPGGHGARDNHSSTVKTCTSGFSRRARGSGPPKPHEDQEMRNIVFFSGPDMLFLLL